MDTIAVNTNLNVDDWRALQAQCPARMRAGETPRAQSTRMLGLTGVFGLVTFATMSVLSANGLGLDPKSLLAGVAAIALALWVNAWFVRRNSAPDENGAFLGPCAYELDAAGLRSKREGFASSAASWAAVRDVTYTATHVFLWVDRFSAYTIPGRDLPQGLTTQQSFDWIAAARARAATSAVPAGPSPIAAPSPGIASSPSVAPSLATVTAEPAPRRRGGWLLDLASLVALRGKPVLTERAQSVRGTLLTLLAVGTWVAVNRWENGPDAEFFVYGLADVAWFLLGGLAVAWVLAWSSSPPIALPRAIVVSALGAWLTIFYFYLVSFVTSRLLAIALAIGGVLYAIAYFGRAARALTGQPQLRPGVAAFLASLAFFWATEALWVYPMVWTPGEDALDAERLDRYDFEPLFFAQPDRLDAALAAVAPNDPAVPEMFFVGFAGYGDEKVFAEEIKFAALTVEERYSHAAGSVLLLNDTRDFDSAPIATATTLRYALRGVAAKMDLDDDVLFLALSSHGSSEWLLSVRNGYLPLVDLTPEDLAAALDDARIKWRIIVISACYAGGFIDALQDPFTIVVAAAAPDRTSFGCSNERELTYFGEAFYRDSLPLDVPLREAFGMADQRVSERERAEGVRESQPMASFGPELEHKLASFE
jgi:hypothetical protein